MKPCAFDYVRVGSVADAVDLLHRDEDARLLAGGQSLVALMNMRLARPSLLVDINRIPGLDVVSEDDGHLTLGALCRHRLLETDAQIRRRAPLLSEAASHVGHPQVRNRGTLGGSLAHADPSSELAAALLALGGTVEVTGPAGTRRVGLGDLVTDVFTTSLAHDEVITSVRVPAAGPRMGTGFAEFAVRPGDFAVVGIAAVIGRDADGTCTTARAAACGVGARPVDLTAALTPLLGARAAGEEALAAVAEAAMGAVRPGDDLRASAADRRELTGVLTVEAVRRAWRRSEEGRS